MRARFTGAAAAVLLLSLSCGIDDPRRPHGSPQYWVHADAFNDAQSACGMTVQIPPFTNLPPWSGNDARVIAGRWLVSGSSTSALRDTLLFVPYAVTQDSNQLVFALGPPLNDTLIGTAIQESKGSSTGTWTCPETFPFAADFNPAPAPTGTWHLTWLLPVD